VVGQARRSPHSSRGSRLAANSPPAVPARTRHVIAREGIRRPPPTPRTRLRGEGLVVSDLRTSHYPCAGRAPPAPAVRCPRKARRPKITITN
jgi:hypothetical protein